MLTQLNNILSGQQWLLEIALVIISGLLISWAEYFVYQHLMEHSKRKNWLWRKGVLESIHRPFLCFLWMMAASLMLPIIADVANWDNAFISNVNVIRQILVLVFILWFSMRFIRYIERHITVFSQRGRRKHDETTVYALLQLLRVIIITIISLILLQTFGIPISALLAFGGISSIAIGFAAKDTLANLFGGVMIYWDRPFSVGDWIRSPDRSIEGTVEYIGWRLTRIRTFDKRPLYVPNGVFSNILLENPSRMSNRRIKTTIGVRYQDADKVSTINKAIEEMLRNHPEIDARQTLFVTFAEYGPSSLNSLVYTFTKTIHWVKFQEVQQDIYLKIMAIVEQHGAEFAFPTQTLHLPDGLPQQHQGNP